MAFSFRAGTNWCHDFPKLARESGFCFNVHRTRVRVDWNRISSIDIDRVIRERDFMTVDDNVNNVVDYSLESEYDVKILDPNFVKLFRLAQLSVEYLLYCKQYLDHSVIILKDELRSKIEDNVLMKKEIKALEVAVKDLNHKMKEKNKVIESKLGDSNGELFKCPHCTKTFIAAAFVNAHIARRHGHLSDPYMPVVSPVHEQYRAETEKLHDEIKTLKERLNQTERVIRNDSDRTLDRRLDISFRPEIYEKGEYTSDKEREERLKEQQIKYQDEIVSLKNMLFTEIRNLKQSDRRSASPVHHVETDANVTNLKELINKQENEIHTLRDQLREKLTPDLKTVQEKLQIQEQHWKVINDRLEKQHKLDTENLTTQLRLNQESAREMKELYESKVNELEMHSRSQSKMLEAQGMHLKQLSRNLLESKETGQSSVQNLQNKSSSRNIDRKVQSIRDVNRINKKNDEHKELVCQDLGSVSSHESPKIFKSPKLNAKSFSQTEDRTSILSGSGDFETSEDNESVKKYNNRHIMSVTKSKKLRVEKKFDVRNDKRNLMENLALETSRRDKLLLDENLRKSRYQENPINGFVTSLENGVQKSRKYRPNVNSSNSESYKPVSSTRSVNNTPKTLIRNMKSEQSLQMCKTKAYDQIPNEKFPSKVNTRKKSMEEAEASEDYSETESSTDNSETDSEIVSEVADIEKIQQNTQRNGNINPRESFKELLHENPDVLEELTVHLRELFDSKMRDLGIDPEWNGVPTVTFKQKMETLAHHRNLNSKKINGYNPIRERLLKEISQKLLKKRSPEPMNKKKLSPLDKIMNKVNIKTTNRKQQKSFELRTPILKSQKMMPREKPSRPSSNLEILPKKMRGADIQEIKSEKSTESTGSLHKNGSEVQPWIKPISVRNTETPSRRRAEIVSRKQTSEVRNRNRSIDDTADSTSLEQLSQSQDGTEYFSESNSVSKTVKPMLQPRNTKVTSTPNKSFADITERSYSSIDEESDDNELINHERAQSLPVSPKNNKSVLKSATGSVGSLVKKKVLFDLKLSLENNGKTSDKTPEKSQSAQKLFPEYDLKNEKANDNDWDISNLSDGDLSLQNEKSPSVENIVLKTSQSEKIAEISKKLQDQLSITRQKPVGAIEAMFLAKPRPKEIEKENSRYKSSTSIASSILESPKKITDADIEVPRPAPRTLRNHESDMESDIEELLQMG